VPGSASKFQAMTEMDKKRKKPKEEEGGSMGGGAGFRGMAQQPQKQYMYQQLQPQHYQPQQSQQYQQPPLPPGCYRTLTVEPITRMPYYGLYNTRTGTLVDLQPAPPLSLPPPSHALHVLNEEACQKMRKKVKKTLIKQRDEYSAQLKKVREYYLAKAINDEAKLKKEKTVLEDSLAKAKEDIEDADEKNKDLTYFINGLHSKIDEIAKLAEEAGADTHKIKEIKERRIS